MKDKPNLVRALRGLSSILVEATLKTTTIVEDMHRTIASGPPALGSPLKPVVKLYTKPIYGGIRGITGLVGIGVERALRQIEPAFEDVSHPDVVEMVRAAINGVVGDHLALTENPLAIEMQLRVNDGTLDFDTLPKKRPLLIYIHGSAMSDIQLMRNGHHHGQKLAEDFGLTCITVRYNSGLHISENGEKLAAKLQELADHVPDVPIIILGFSMGGLVARSAVNLAEKQSLSWRNRLRGMIFLGTPHHGAPLERMGNVFQKLLESTGYSAPIARLARLRSAGVTDLRFGSLLREHWSGAGRFDHVPDARTPVPLPTDVLCFAVAGTLSKSLDEGPESFSGDGLVPVSSALGEHENSALNLGLQEHEKKVILNCGHLDLLDHPLVSQELHAFLTTTSKDNLT